MESDQQRVKETRGPHADTPQESERPQDIRPSGIPGSAILVMGFAATIIGVWRAIDLRWISDDIFITLRYVQNWFDGHGLVYNIGEYVEGYTHFLWLLLIAATRVFGAAIDDSSVWLGIISYAALLVLWTVVAYRERTRWGILLLLIPCMLAANYDMAVWASGGLETMFFAVIISLAVVVWYFSGLTRATRVITVGTLLVLGSLTRPDGALFYIVAAAALLIDGVRERRPFTEAVRELAMYAAAFFIIVVPYGIWKLAYYGDLLPLTFHAKSGGTSYFEQGFFYIWLYAKTYLSSFLVLAAAPVLILALRRRSAARRSSIDLDNIGMLATLCSGVVVYLVVFVARVGGDFMYARFIIPVVPLFILIIADTVRRAIGSAGMLPAIACGGLVLFACVENVQRTSVLFDRTEEGQLVQKWDHRAGGDNRGIVDERLFYVQPIIPTQRGELKSQNELARIVGMHFDSLFHGLDVTVAIPNGQNNVAYYSQFKNCIVVSGLTDKYIASMPITTRGRIGHEKSAPTDYLFERGTNFALIGGVDPPATRGLNDAYFEVPAGPVWFSAKVLRFDRAITDSLRARSARMHCGLVLSDFEDVARHYIAEVLPRDDQRGATMMWSVLERGDFAADPALRQSFIDAYRQRFGVAPLHITAGQ